MLSGLKIAVVGHKTALHLQKYGLQHDFIPPEFVADSLVAHFPNREKLNGTKILYPQLEAGGRELIMEELTSYGADVTAVPAYQSCCGETLPLDIQNALKLGQIDVVTFASPKTAQCFSQFLEQMSIKPEFCIASIDPQTSIACRQYLGRVDVEALVYTLDGLIEAIVKWKQSGIK